MHAHLFFVKAEDAKRYNTISEWVWSTEWF
jgi:hypothetical protein